MSELLTQRVLYRFQRAIQLMLPKISLVGSILFPTPVPDARGIFRNDETCA